jgi:hypothetical protein
MQGLVTYSNIERMGCIRGTRRPYDPRSKLVKPLTLAAMSLGFGVVQLDVTIVNTALSSIGASLGGGISELQWVVSIYTELALRAISVGAKPWRQDGLYCRARLKFDRLNASPSRQS